jgi:hypothetical protein
LTDAGLRLTTIQVLDKANGAPLGISDYKYGLRVSVIALRSPPVWTTERGLEVGGPKAFGYVLFAFIHFSFMTRAKANNRTDLIWITNLSLPLKLPTRNRRVFGRCLERDHDDMCNDLDFCIKDARFWIEGNQEMIMMI